jgi:SAM-dependent methyltransferase
MSLDDKPIAYDAYEQLAERYARLIDTKPHNALYEWPAVLALLPDVSGLRVLDAGCGTGRYTAWLLDHGAQVIGIDASPAMLHYAHERVSGRAELRLADLNRPLDFLGDAAFELVVSALVIHYVADINALFAEFHRVLRPEGLFIFSTGHPFGDFLYFKSENYFATEAVGAAWHGFGGEPVYVPQYRQPLSAITEALWRAGFVIECLTEPLPTEEFRQADPRHYDELMHLPGFMCVRARRIEREKEMLQS